MRPSAALSTPRRRRALFFGLYACEDAPIGFIWWALPSKPRAVTAGWLGGRITKSAGYPAAFAALAALSLLSLPLLRALKAPAKAAG